MPVQLAQAIAALEDVQMRADDFIDALAKKNTNFWSHFNQVLEGTTELANEVATNGNASPLATTMQDELTNLKRTARNESDDAYVLINRLMGIRREADALRAEVDGVIRHKAGKIKSSSSIDGLREVSATLNTLSNRITTEVNTPPHRSTHGTLQ